MSTSVSTFVPMPAPELLTPPHHGADLAAASRRYGIPLSDWLDLSTGINPNGYPVASIDSAACQHLPVDDGELREAAKNYCGAPSLPVAAAGSQVLIQWLPLVRTQLTQRQCRVAVPAIGYSEHAFRWQWAGHTVVTYDPQQAGSIDALLQRDAIDVLIVINAHNPLALTTAPERLLAWHAQLVQRGGWLIVDEAFVDPTPAYSVAAHTDRDGLIVLRSLGKFFGLAGVRCGFAFCSEPLVQALQVAVGPWSVAGPTLAIATRALRDTEWQQATRAHLQSASAENAALLRDWSGRDVMRHGLFNSVLFDPITAVHLDDALARSGIRVRLVETEKDFNLLRFGLVDPADGSAWQRLTSALSAIPPR